jgi:hypothetical protein
MIPRRRLKTSTDPRDYRDASVTRSKALAQLMVMTGGVLNHPQLTTRRRWNVPDVPKAY